VDKLPPDENRLVSHYPAPISQAFQHMHEARHATERHKRMLELAETIVSYVASIAWSEYAELGPRSPELDAWVGGIHKASFGHWVQLLQRSAEQAQRSIINFPIDQKFDSREFEHQSAFISTWEAVRKGLCKYRVPTNTLPDFVRDQVRTRPAPKVTVLDFMRAVNNCRNHAHHPADKGYTLDEHTAGILNPPLEKGLLEMLFLNPFHTALVEHAWAVPESNARVQLDGEDHLLQARYQRRSDGWKQVLLRSKRRLQPVGYLVRAADGEPYISFSYAPGRWPLLPAGPAPAGGPAPAPAGAAPRQDVGLERYAARYRDYLLDDGVVTRKEETMLEDLAELAGLSGTAVQAVRDRVDADPEVIRELARLRGAAPGDAARPPEPSPEAPQADADTHAAGAEGAAVLARLVERLGSSGRWHPASFMEHLAEQAGGEAEPWILELLSLCAELGELEAVSITWGRGKQTGSFTLKAGGISLLSAYTSGSVTLNLGSWGVMDPWLRKRLMARFDALAGTDLAVRYDDTAHTFPDVSTLGRLMGPARLRAWLTESIPLAVEAAAVPYRLARAAMHLRLEGAALKDELLQWSRSALTEDWQETVAGIRWPHTADQPHLRGQKTPGLADGRLGVDLLSTWKPGLFVGVMVDPSDHRTRESEPSLGADFVVIVDVHRGSEREGVDGDQFIASPEFLQLTERLQQGAEGWSFHHHAADAEGGKPNLWHPIHLRVPLVRLLRDAPSSTARSELLSRAAHDGVRVVLAGGELARLVARLQGVPVDPSLIARAAEVVSDDAAMGAGFGLGAAFGAMVAGPPGAIVGSALGAMLGRVGGTAVRTRAETDDVPVHHVAVLRRFCTLMQGADEELSLADLDLHVKGSLPSRKLSNAIRSYMPEVEPGDVIILYDDTLLGGARLGFALTETALYWRSDGEQPQALERSEIRSVISRTDDPVPGVFLNDQRIPTPPDEATASRLAAFLEEWRATAPDQG